MLMLNGGKITVEIYGNKVRMILADRGPGIKNIDQAMQAGWSTASEEARNLGFGAGMGLPNMKRNATEHENRHRDRSRYDRHHDRLLLTF